MHKVRQLAKGSASALSMMLLGRSTAFVLQVMLSRYLGASAYGIMVLVTSVARLGQQFTVLGINQGVVRFGAGYAAAQDAIAMRALIRKSAWLVGLLSAAGGTLLWLMRERLVKMLGGDPRLDDLMGVAVLILVMLSVLSWISGLLQSQQQPGRAVLVREAIPSLARIVVIGVIMLVGGGLAGIMWGFAVGTAVALLVGLVYVVRFTAILRAWSGSPGGVAHKVLAPEVRELLRVSLPMFLSGFSYAAILYLDRFMIAHYLEDPVQVGVYHAAATIAIQMNVVLAACISMFAPMITGAHQKGDKEQLVILFRSVTWWAFLLSVPLLVVVAMNAEFLMSLFGPDFPAGAQLLVILAAAQAYNIFTGPVGIMLQMTGRQKVDLYINLALVVANVALNIVLIPSLGVDGAALATFISVVAVHSVRLIIVKRAFGVHPFSRRLVVLGLTTTAVLGVAYSLAGELPLIVSLLWTTGILLVLGLFLYVRGLDDVDHDLVRRAADRLFQQRSAAKSGRRSEGGCQ